jgi:hypothetical protein
MPVCVLRVAGDCARVQQFLAQSRLQPDTVFWRGEGRGNGRVVARSGFNLLLSESNGLPEQAQQVTAWAVAHEDAVRLIARFGFESVSIDFGLHGAATQERPWPSDSIPVAIARLAAQLGASIELSFYE